MTQLYECMFVLNNDAVRAGWSDAKASVTLAVEKHGGKVLSARHWAERRLAYPIRHRNRATYLRAFCDMPAAAVDPLSRELNISETVLRYLFLSSKEVPAEELELSKAEQEKEFTLPEPPADDAVEEVEEPVSEAPAPAAGPGEGAGEAPQAAAADADSGEGEGEAKAQPEAPAAEAPEDTAEPEAAKPEETKEG